MAYAILAISFVKATAAQFARPALQQLQQPVPKYARRKR
jgi:hypothetical protein